MIHITPEFIAERLNEWFNKDPKALDAWTRIMHAKCNDILADDDHMLVREYDPQKRPECPGTWVTPLGLLNAILTSAGHKDVVAAMVATIDDRENLIGFGVKTQIKK